MTQRLIAIAAAIMALAAPAWLGGQTPPQAPASERQEFEAASIKPNTSGIPRVALQFPNGRLNGINVTMQMLILNAYRMQAFQLVGAPEWVGNDRFDVVATAGSLPNPQLPLLLQSLLADRLRLAVHRETREAPVYGLVLSRSDGRLGPQIRKSELDCAALAAAARGRGQLPPVAAGQEGRRTGPGVGGPPPGQAQPGRPGQAQNQAQMQAMGCGSMFGGNQMRSQGQTMAQLATSLSGRVNRVVIDRTGLDGVFDFELQWTPDQFQGAGPLGGIPGAPPSAGDGSGPSLFTALQEQLGLKLESQRSPIEVLVIDRIERPTPD